MTGQRVTVVGGGLAGITAALDCADEGARVTLLEVRPQLGGAAYSFDREGLRVDNGQHVFLRCCTAYRALIERLGAEHETVLQRRLAIPVLAPGGRIGWLRRSGLPAPLHLAGALMRYQHLRPRERVGAARAALALARLDPEDPSLDRESFDSWLAAHGQSKSAIDALWNLIALPTLNLPAPEASLALAAFVFQTGLLRERDAGDVGYTRVPLSVVHAERTAGALARAGVDVRLRHRVEEIATTDGGTFAVRGAFEPVEADAVVLAVPHDRAAGLLPPGAHAAPERFEKLGKSPILNVHVLYDRRVTDLPFAAAIDSPAQWVFDRTEAASVGDGQYLAVSLSGASGQMALPVEDVADRHIEALAELFPAARAASVRKCFVTREHAATFRATPGSRALRPGPRTAVRGLVLAGAWTDTGWPATMEGAVRSGHTAAREALAAVLPARSPAARVAA